MKVADLKPRLKVPEIELKIKEKKEERNVKTRFGEGRVCDAVGEDEDGATVTVSLWNDEIDKVEVNSKIRIKNGWTSEWRGNLQVSAGRFGEIEIIEE
jgi:replication factor A1